MTITTAEKQLSSPRELCKSEKDSLCQLIRDILNIDPSNDEDIEDADILIEYVFDMIDEQATVGHIMKEVSCNACIYHNHTRLAQLPYRHRYSSYPYPYL